ncbi:MAG: hypothetical protein Q4D81_14480, partial [Eubacteriales bacterium]|nr:hypothetical protein [Eubacteriales bacterium]
AGAAIYTRPQVFSASDTADDQKYRQAECTEQQSTDSSGLRYPGKTVRHTIRRLCLCNKSFTPFLIDPAFHETGQSLLFFNPHLIKNPLAIFTNERTVTTTGKLKKVRLSSGQPDGFVQRLSSRIIPYMYCFFCQRPSAVFTKTRVQSITPAYR